MGVWLWQSHTQAHEAGSGDMKTCWGHAMYEDSGLYLLLPRALSLLLRAPPHIPVLLRPRDRPHNPFQPGPISPKAFYQFWKLYRSAYRGQRWENMPAPNQCAHAASSAKQSSRMHLKQAVHGGGGRWWQSVCPEGNPSVLRSQPFSQPPPAQDNRAGMCVAQGSLLWRLHQ